MRLTRWGPAAVIAVLLAGTAAAFVLAQRQKLEPSPILGTKVTKVFSPVCRCPTSRARVKFSLRRGDRVTVAIVRGDGEAVVRRLVSRRPFGPGPVILRWDGRGRRGRVVAEDTYRARVELVRQRRDFLIPNPIRLDTTRPRVNFDVVVRRREVLVRYRLSEQAQPLVFVDGRRVVRGRRREVLAGELRWNAKALRPGRHRLTLVAEDPAGNRSRSSAPVAFELS
ncbi:MAG: hypothetical protein H0T39_13690 [Actinobacteria bacterium]|nr:hypothetical protein [Actinomycetota bacterium]